MPSSFKKLGFSAFLFFLKIPSKIFSVIFFHKDIDIKKSVKLTCENFRDSHMLISDLIINVRNICRDNDIYCLSKINQTVKDQIRELYMTPELHGIISDLVLEIEIYGRLCSEMQYESISKKCSYEDFLSLKKDCENKLDFIKRKLTKVLTNKELQQ